MKRKIFFLVGLSLMLFFCGCETTKGAVDGVVKDSKNLWGALVAADQWMQKNLW